MRPDQERFLTELRKHRIIKRAYTDSGLGRNNFYSQRRREPEFARAVQAILDGVDGKVYSPGEVPNFLDWRTRHCAYLITKPHIDGAMCVRAENYWFQYEAIKALQEYDNLIMVLPPGHLKTTLLIEYVTWRIMKDRNFRGLIVRANESVAQDNTAAIGVRLSNHDYYADLARRLSEQGEEPISNPIVAYGGRHGFEPQGRKIGERWAGGEFTVAGRTSGEKDATVKAIGMGGAIPGYRADVIILDDPQDPSKFDASGAEHSAKLMKIWERDLLGRVLPGGKRVVLANRLGPDDFIGMLCDRYKDNPNWKIIYFPAIIEKYGRAQPLLPQVFTMQDLEERKADVGDEAWAFHYMQEEISLASAAFTRDQLDACKDYDRALGDVPEGLQIVLGIDPAVAASGFCAMVVWGVRPATGQRYLVDFLNEQNMKSEDNIAAEAAFLVKQYGIRTVVCETNNIQATVYAKVKEAVAPYGARCLPYQTISATGARAQETDFDITSLSTLATERRINLPYMPESRRKMDVFITQFIKWRPRPPGKSSWHLTRDLVMATLFAESEARKLVKLANRGPLPKKYREVPRWTEDGDGGWAWKNALDDAFTH